MGLPEVALTGARFAECDADVAAVGVRMVDSSPVIGPAAETLGHRLGLDLALLVERASSPGRAGEVTDVPVGRRDCPVERVLLVGLGDASPPAARRAGAAIGRQAAKGARVASDTGAGLDAPALRAHVEGLLLATYRFSLASTAKPLRLSNVDLHAPARANLRRAVANAGVTARAVSLARDLANRPSNEKDPAWLARRATQLGRRAGLEVTVRDDKALRAEGFGGLLAVGAGSSRPPRLIELAYAPARLGRRTPHVVLVGKGITFDSGGLSLKPREAM